MGLKTSPDIAALKTSPDIAKGVRFTTLPRQRSNETLPMAPASGWTALRSPRLRTKICEATYSPHCTVGGISSLRIILQHTVDFEHQLAPSWRPTGKVVEEGGGKTGQPTKRICLEGTGASRGGGGAEGAATAAAMLGSDLGKVAAYNAADGSPRRSPTRRHALLRPSDPFN